MVEIVNLRRARKAKARQAAEAKAEANRIAFGRTRVERQSASLENARAARELDAHRREPSPARDD